MNTRNIQMASNKWRDVERYFFSSLSDIYEVGEIRQFVRMLAEAFLGWDTTRLLLRRDETINQSDLLKFHWAVEDLKSHRPIQHIIGYTEFCDCKIRVDGSVLIPRPETEEIVLNLGSILTEVPHNVLDVCTGSGCIAIALARKWGECSISAVDISSDALALARKNAEDNGVRVNFFLKNVLGEELPDQSFDLIISNPPYIMQKERSVMERNVLDYEPEIALFVSDDDPLLFYRVIAQYASSHLSPKGFLVFEINEKLGEETATMLQELGFSTHLFKDFREKDRMLVGRLSHNIT